MTKVVINACFGGFSLSEKGLAAYLARKGETAYFYEEDRSSGSMIGERDYIRVDLPASSRLFGPTCVVEDFGPRATKDQIWKSGAYRSHSDIERGDRDLVAVVEELGDEASGSCAALQVVEIPDGVAWEIAEYDGAEHIAEQHRTWHP